MLERLERLESQSASHEIRRALNERAMTNGIEDVSTAGGHRDGAGAAVGRWRLGRSAGGGRQTASGQNGP